MPPLLQAKNIQKNILDYGRPIPLLHDISLSIRSGALAMISGPSGSGKSTLLYLLGLLDEADTGHLWINGQDVSQLNPAEKTDFRLNNLGFVFQFHFLLAEFSALYNVMIPLLRQGISEKIAANKAHALLEQLDLGDKAQSYPAQLSGGQRQRVAIARSLINNPSIIFADEPTGSLDSKNAQRVFSIFKDLCHNAGKTVVMVTHDPDFVQQADQNIRIIDGKTHDKG